ncbi:hypothetical protein CBER1_00587 [Cercospora berteroae]|uniref:Uncharacterized protein n=1 Tax=Cercospora berteroae TaxID=357750 RepID=A0A2S6CBG8_9PEZI|nr:hypothetical protein CBER1_00587 [Cercospora berteroae]
MPGLSDELSIIVDGIAAAIHSSLKKLVSNKIADPPMKNQVELDIAGMRDQILANVKYLHPLLAGADVVEGAEFEVLTVGVGTSVSASVVFTKNELRRVFILGPDAEGEANALRKLLGMTSALLCRKWTGFYSPGNGWKAVRLEGQGKSYYFDNPAMSTRATGELPDMGDNIVTAINKSMDKAIEAKIVAVMEESVEKMVETKVAAALKAASNKGEKSEPELEGASIRDQILTNASFLYQLLGGLDSDGHSFELVTCGVGAKVAGCVVYMDDGCRHVLLRGPEGRGEPKALQELLAMTSQLMHDKWTEFFRPADSWKQVDGRGNSYYCTAKR